MDCKHRKVHTWHGEVFHVDPASRVALSAIGISSERDWLDFQGGVSVSHSLTTTNCYRCDLQDSGAVYFKRYVYPPNRAMDFWMRPGKAAVEFWAYSQLRRLGIPTLQVIAFGERRRFGMLQATCIVTKGIPDTIDLEHFVGEVWCHWPRAKRIQSARAIGARVLAQARRAHQGGFFHHDLKWRNLLINPDGDPDTLVWIDAPRASRMRFRERRGVITDLSGLARIAISLFSRFELMRFLHLYLGSEADSAEAKQLFRQVASHLGRRMPRPLRLSYPD